MEARLHQAPKESMIRFNDLKNYILSYPNLRVSKSWKYENFIYKGKTIIKVTLHGQTMRIYLDLDPGQFVDTKYRITDQSNIKTHQLTPIQLRIKGPRGLMHAKDLIDMVFKNLEHPQDAIPNTDYRLENLSKEKLIERGLIKVVKNRDTL